MYNIDHKLLLNIVPGLNLKGKIHKKKVLSLKIRFFSFSKISLHNLHAEKGEKAEGGEGEEKG